jgi:hypothetical protein
MIDILITRIIMSEIEPRIPLKGRGKYNLPIEPSLEMMKLEMEWGPYSYFMSMAIHKFALGYMIPEQGTITSNRICIPVGDNRALVWDRDWVRASTETGNLDSDITWEWYLEWISKIQYVDLPLDQSLGSLLVMRIKKGFLKIKSFLSNHLSR